MYTKAAETKESQCDTQRRQAACLHVIIPRCGLVSCCVPLKVFIHVYPIPVDVDENFSRRGVLSNAVCSSLGRTPLWHDFFTTLIV